MVGTLIIFERTPPHGHCVNCQMSTLSQIQKVKNHFKKMPQAFQVLQCFYCSTFQVDIQKKVPKWQCKMCGEKQSLQNIYGNGTGQECRLLVQSLNQRRFCKQQVDTESEEFLDSTLQGKN